MYEQTDILFNGKQTKDIAKDMCNMITHIKV